VEKTICTSPALGKLDDALTDNYNAMLATNLGDGGASLKKEQRAWIAQRNKCTTDQCLIDLYRKRVDDVCDAPVVTGVHAACVQASDISAGPATPPIQGALKPASAQVVGTVTDGSDPATGLGFKEYVIGKSKKEFSLARCVNIDNRSDLQMCLPKNVQTTIAEVPAVIKILTFKDDKLASVEVDIPFSNRVGGEVLAQALVAKYGQPQFEGESPSHGANHRWYLGENEIDSEVYVGEAIATMFFNKAANAEILAAQKHEQSQDLTNAKKAVAADM
jgi:hypothetical protein